MHIIDRIELKPDTKEELLPSFSYDFPYIASRVELDKSPEYYIPWHWHNTLELFYMESGTLEYCTPGVIQVFSAGSGGLVNSNVLHMTRSQPGIVKNVQFIHLFDPVFIAGEKGNKIDMKYVMPLTSASQIEMIALHPDTPEQKEILDLLKTSFTLSDKEYGYELKIRQMLSEIWLKIFELSKDQIQKKSAHNKSSDQIKMMMVYIHEHYAEQISVKELANAAYLSVRGCYRVFQECLHMTPTEYIRSYRLQMACQMLVDGNGKLTEISQACGLGSSSYFGKVFKEIIGCTPQEYRRRQTKYGCPWQDSDIKMQK